MQHTMLMEKTINVVTTKDSMLLRGIRPDTKKHIPKGSNNVKLRVTLPILAVLLEVD